MEKSFATLAAELAVAMQKSQVKAHTRKTKSGKVVNVKAHADKRTKHTEMMGGHKINLPDAPHKLSRQEYSDHVMKQYPHLPYGHATAAHLHDRHVSDAVASGKMSFKDAEKQHGNHTARLGVLRKLSNEGHTMTPAEFAKVHKDVEYPGGPTAKESHYNTLKDAEKHGKAIPAHVKPHLDKYRAEEKVRDAKDRELHEIREKNRAEQDEKSDRAEHHYRHEAEFEIRHHSIEDGKFKEKPVAKVKGHDNAVAHIKKLAAKKWGEGHVMKPSDNNGHPYAAHRETGDTLQIHRT